MTRVAVYRRISEDREGQALGVERQLEDCLRRASIEGWRVAEIFTDNDVGASRHSRKPRPGYKRMLAAARRGEFEVILAYSNSRLTRRPAELEDLIQLHEQTGVRICTIVSGDDDLSTSAGRMVARIKASIDAAEAEQIAERVTRAARQRAERGGNHGGRRAFGWNLDGSPREPEFSALRDGILAVTRGASIRSVAKAWDAAGLVSTGGKPWTPTITNTRLTLTRWRNAGIRVHRGEPLFDAPEACAPAVTREQLEELHDHLCDRGRRRNRGRVAQAALLGSLVTCGGCGSPMRASTHEVSRSNPTRVGTYRCSGPRGCATIRRAHLDEMVVDAVIIELLTADLTVLADSAEDRARLIWLRAQLAALEAREGELAEDYYGRGELSRAAFQAANAALQIKKAETEQALRDIAERFAPAEFIRRERDLMMLSDEDRDAEAATVLERFEALELHRRREIILGLFRIVVNPGRVDDRVVIVARASGTETSHDWRSRVTFTPGPPPPSAPGQAGE